MDMVWQEIVDARLKGAESVALEPGEWLLTGSYPHE